MKRELGAFAMHRLRDAAGDRALGREADDQGAFAGEKSHGLLRGGPARSLAQERASDSGAPLRDVHDEPLARLDHAARVEAVPAEQVGEVTWNRVAMRDSVSPRRTM